MNEGTIMITRTGQIEFNRYMALEKIYGSDKALAIINEVTGRLEKQGYLYSNKYTDSQISRRSDEIYAEVIEEWKDDDIPYDN